MPLIDFQQCTWLRSTSCWKICEISEPSLGILENFQCRSALFNKKYNYVVLFWVNCIGYLLMFQNFFPTGHHCKIHSKFSDLLEKDRNFWTSYHTRNFVSDCWYSFVESMHFKIKIWRSYYIVQGLSVRFKIKN